MQTTWLERGTVSGRVALLLRSAEIQPLFIDLSDWIHTSNPPLHSSNGWLELQGRLSVGGWAAAKGLPCVLMRCCKRRQEAVLPHDATPLACLGPLPHWGKAPSGTWTRSCIGAPSGNWTRACKRQQEGHAVVLSDQ